MEPTNPEQEPTSEGTSEAPTPAPVIYNLLDLPKTIQAILRVIKDAPHAVKEGDLLDLELPYSQTALFFLKKNHYVKVMGGWYRPTKLYTHPEHQAKVEKLLSTQF